MKKSVEKKGSGVVNNWINNLPFEAHLKGYNYCGPGTKLIERLKRGDKGVNALDDACKQHDIYYGFHKNNEERQTADKLLLSRAWKRVKAEDSSVGEKLAALAVTTAIKGKLTFGMGIKKRNSGRKKRRTAGGSILPIIAGLSSVISAGATVARAIKSIRNAKKKISTSSTAGAGRGVFLKPSPNIKRKSRGRGIKRKRRVGKRKRRF